jgi:hypothetical protein
MPYSKAKLSQSGDSLASGPRQQTRKPCGLHRPGRPASGSTLIEALTGLFVMSVAVTSVAQLAVLAHTQGRQQRMHAVAVQEAANLMDRIVADGWEELGRQRVSRYQLSELVGQQLPAAELQVALTDDPGPPKGRRVAVTIAWKSSPGAEPRRVRLTSWVFPPVGDRP